ncbi:MAG: zinc metalloprotease HtpX [Candidatus Buchananbacteria bacterium RBG_13_39_9]|uniref:Protease HtpX homolog n=1 Tax=Candidatus Buchananbacteria bacterium RBG_13_39_9 TaxID=1797531 RepID=A0A1G1XNQ4_9BACT|nr:MAG: zinc metalloprotease HtpX [Candidatus Buchananbacteria bacterium RBG_13_39_9]
MYNQIDSNKRKTVILIIIFIAFILIIGWFYGYLTDGGYSGVILALIVSLAMASFSYFGGDKLALATAGAKEIAKQDNPYVYRLVENLCITAGLPPPKVYIIPDPNINAFATGRDPQHASVAITQGAIDKLENEELEGVIAHELSHIKNFDIRLMMVVIVLVGIIALISDWMLRGFFWNKSDRDKGGAAVLIIVGIVLAILSPLIAQLIQLAVSRKREYLADADGSLLTRYPQGLANALEKINQENIQPLRRANNATAHLYIANPFGQTKKFLSKLFSTHPPIEDRITRLRQMA